VTPQVDLSPSALPCRLTSYNIHQCLGTDGQREPGRIAGVLREIEPDLVGLQEVDSVIGGATGSAQLDYLTDALGLQAISGPTILRHDGHYGNALLTRHPVVDVRHIDLTVYPREPRAAIDADIDIHGTVVRFVVTHLGLLPGERRFQVRRLIAALDGSGGRQTGAAPRHRPVVLCGDINEWFAIGRPLRWLDARLGRRPSLRTFPSPLPLFALDRIWTRPVAVMRRLAVHDSAAARVASDHLPVVAELDLSVLWPPRLRVANPAAAP
jgi:endonuclease/exonuclease/phosphatase family metal-dependent hydrolase